MAGGVAFVVGQTSLDSLPGVLSDERGHGISSQSTRLQAGRCEMCSRNTGEMVVLHDVRPASPAGSASRRTHPACSAKTMSSRL